VPQPEVDDSFERWEQVGVAREQDERVVLPAECQMDQVDG
jgi:hypothetical protein